MLFEIDFENSAVPGFTVPIEADSDLERRIAAFLAGQHRPSLRSIEIQARNGVVTISGAVSTFYEKQLSLHFVQRVAGVIQLIDDVTVISQSTLNNHPADAYPASSRASYWTTSEGNSFCRPVS